MSTKPAVLSPEEVEELLCGMPESDPQFLTFWNGLGPLMKLGDTDRMPRGFTVADLRAALADAFAAGKEAQASK